MTTGLHVLADRAASVIRRRFPSLASLSQPTIVTDKTRSLVLRCQADWPMAGRAHVRSVMIKYMRDDLSRGFTEWASLEFLSGVPEADDLVPRFLGGDIEHRLVILEDLGGSRNLEDVLRTSDARTAESTLRSMAVGMARLQAATFGRESAFAAVRSALPNAEVGRRVEAQNWLRNWEQIVRWFQALDCPIPGGLERCVQDIANLYANPGPFLCFSHGDPAPSNNHIAAGRVRLLDFEYGAFRHALYDLSGWNVLCPLPARVVQTMSHCFRDEMGKTCPVVRDDQLYAHAWAAVCTFRALSILTWIKPDILQEDRPWVDELWTCRHAVLAAVSRMQEATFGVRELAPVTDAADRLSRELRRRWPEFQNITEVAPYWPAFAR